MYQTLAISLLAMFLLSFLLVCPSLYFDIFSCNSTDTFLTYYQMYWINSGVYNLGFKPFLLELHDWKTVFEVLGYFEQYFMPCYLQGFISKIQTVWQYHNSERGTVSIQEVLHRIGYFGLLCMSRTVSMRQSMWNCPPDCILPGQFQILHRWH